MPARSSPFLEKLGEEKAIAVLRTSIKEAARPAMEAAIAGGFRIVEFTLNTPGALELIAEYAKRPELTVGAGTVLTTEEAAEAIARGAEFIVSPVVDEKVIAFASEQGIPSIPGCGTATEMLRAQRAGAPLQKLFPGPANGPAFVQACLGPLPFLRIVPTSGVTLENIPEFLRAGAHAFGFVAPLFDRVDLAEKQFHRTEEKARALLAAVRSG